MKIEAHQPMTPAQWQTLSYIEQKQRWPELSAAEQAAIKAAESIVPTTPAQPEAARPASAVICYLFAVISMIGAGGTVVSALNGEVPNAGYLIAGCVAGGVLWWALGDIVAFLAKIARR